MTRPRPLAPPPPPPPAARRRRRFVGPAIAAATVGAVLLGAGAYGLSRSPSTTSTGTAPAGSASVSARGSATAAAGPSTSASPSGSASPSSSPSPSKKPATGCTVTGGTAGCPAGPPVAAAAGKRWRLSFSEEFTGTDYDHGKLTPCFDWNTGDCTSTFNQGREHYQPSQVVVSGGIAKLIAAPLSPARADSACQNGQCTYKAGLLSTARPNAANGSGYLYKFTYGYVEARIKFPATRGFFTAFWMLPAEPSYSYRSEIDILEMLGNDPKTMFMTYHHSGRDQSYAVNKGQYNNGACAVKDYSTSFVRMGLDWQPGHIAWYIDGKKCGQFSDASKIENGPMQIILHMMVDNNWQRRWNVGLTDPTLTRSLSVDYLRVYQQVPA
ncbi:MAG: family 16 glycosylhydrolase [Hamadaea sp.]|nr:family 16 glycosylhydrolase [Hamadaea sp.]